MHRLSNVFKFKMLLTNSVQTGMYVESRDVNETRETRDSKKFLGIEH